ncbi:MAG: membrane dipeptidase, partial [Verrucomicrobia bacterium]|nr:membrane dipeptidase [Verrucomicrobiota bacterium]
MKPYPIADLHNDLLSFLITDSKRSINDPESRGSYPQMKQGNVAFQALAVYTPTDSNSYVRGQKQLQMFSSLLSSYPEKYTLWKPSHPVQINGPIAVCLSFESAHGICEESQDIGVGLSNLEKTLHNFKNILYISLTWNLENRLGGGCGSRIGLKEDGKRLLQWMDKKKIAV